MRLGVVCAGIALVAIPGTAAAASRVIETTWAKPGVSFAEYRQDANLCAQGAMQIDISGTDAARRAVKASKALDNAYDDAFGMGSSMGSSAFPGGMTYYSLAAISRIESLRMAYRPETAFADVKAWQLQVLHGCLRGLGYHQVALTAEQQATLKRLPLRSKRRAHYLHGIASRPAAAGQQPS